MTASNLTATTDYEALDALFDKLGYGLVSDPEDGGEVSFDDNKGEPGGFESWLAARKQWKEPGHLRTGEIEGRRYFIAERAQAYAGQPRRDVVAIELADGRLALYGMDM